MFSKRLVVVKWRPVLHYCVVIFFWSSGIMGCICLLLKKGFRLFARVRQWCGIYHNIWWSALLKPRLLFCSCRLCFLRAFLFWICTRHSQFYLSARITVSSDFCLTARIRENFKISLNSIWCLLWISRPFIAQMLDALPVCWAQHLIFHVHINRGLLNHLLNSQIVFKLQ